ncbi:MAG: response regulator transcription factor [Lachnospiraceae bacterium]|nr:response regulator transcription factor [Lachnospiraceae bacterium]
MKILVADDERDIADALGMILKYSGYESEVVYNGTDADRKLHECFFDGVILDIMMPGMSGIEVLSRMRRDGDRTPVILLTAKAEIEDKVAGLQSGADDYVPKPFDRRELLARLQSVIRRGQMSLQTTITLGDTRLDPENQVSCKEASLRLTSTEGGILGLLMDHPGRMIDSISLKDRFWKEEEYEEGELQLYISYLRNKLKSIHSDLSILDRDGGYVLQMEHPLETV